MTKAFFIDTSLCMACRGCQVACKQWHDLPAEDTQNMGGYQNPQDLSFSTYKLVEMTEQVVDGKLRWLFFPAQCRHCLEAPCLETVGDPEAIYRDQLTGAVIFTANTRHYNAEEIRSSCPYDIPRKGPDNVLAKCDMCVDRVHNGLEPACVKTCPTSAMMFGKREELLAKAKERLKQVKAKSPDAMLIDPDDVSTIYLVEYAPDLYGKHVIASRAGGGVTRNVALRRMLRPLANTASHIFTG